MKVIDDLEDRECLLETVVQDLKLYGIKVPRVKKTLSRNKLTETKSCNNAVFGNSLCNITSVVVDDVGTCVPRFLHEAVSFIEEHITTEGIFRKSGSQLRQRQLREKLDIDDHLPKDCQVFDVATLFKVFFRELLEPLICRHLHDGFVRCLDLEREERAASTLLLCALLPMAHRSVLKYTMQFLRRVASHSAQNKMDLYNLAVVMAPNLMRTDDKPASPRLFQQQTDVVNQLFTVAGDIGKVSDSVHGRAQQLARWKSEEDLSRSPTYNESAKKHRSGSFGGIVNSFKHWGRRGNKTPGGAGYMQNKMSASLDSIKDDKPHTPKIAGSAAKRKATDDLAFSDIKKKAVLKNLPDNYVLSTPNNLHRSAKKTGFTPYSVTPSVVFVRDTQDVSFSAAHKDSYTPKYKTHFFSSSKKVKRKELGHTGHTTEVKPSKGRGKLMSRLKRLSGGKTDESQLPAAAGARLCDQDATYTEMPEGDSSFFGMLSVRKRKSRRGVHRKAPSSPAVLITPASPPPDARGATPTVTHAASTSQLHGGAALVEPSGTDSGEEVERGREPVSRASALEGDRDDRPAADEAWREEEDVGGRDGKQRGTLRRGRPNSLNSGLGAKKKKKRPSIPFPRMNDERSPPFDHRQRAPLSTSRTSETAVPSLDDGMTPGARPASSDASRGGDAMLLETDIDDGAFAATRRVVVTRKTVGARNEVTTVFSRQRDGGGGASMSSLIYCGLGPAIRPGIGRESDVIPGTSPEEPHLSTVAPRESGVAGWEDPGAGPAVGPEKVVERSEPMEVGESSEPAEVRERSEPAEVRERSKSAKVRERSEPMEVEESSELAEVRKGSKLTEVGQRLQPAEVRGRSELVELRGRSELAEVSKRSELAAKPVEASAIGKKIRAATSALRGRVFVKSVSDSHVAPPRRRSLRRAASCVSASSRASEVFTVSGARLALAGETRRLLARAGFTPAPATAPKPGGAAGLRRSSSSVGARGSAVAAPRVVTKVKLFEGKASTVAAASERGGAAVGPPSAARFPKPEGRTERSRGESARLSVKAIAEEKAGAVARTVSRFERRQGAPAAAASRKRPVRVPSAFPRSADAAALMRALIDDAELSLPAARVPVSSLAHAITEEASCSGSENDRRTRSKDDRKMKAKSENDWIKTENDRRTRFKDDRKMKAKSENDWIKTENDRIKTENDRMKRSENVRKMKSENDRKASSQDDRIKGSEADRKSRTNSENDRKTKTRSDSDRRSRSADDWKRRSADERRMRSEAAREIRRAASVRAGLNPPPPPPPLLVRRSVSLCTTAADVAGRTTPARRHGNLPVGRSPLKVINSEERGGGGRAAGKRERRATDACRVTPSPSPRRRRGGGLPTPSPSPHRSHKLKPVKRLRGDRLRSPYRDAAATSESPRTKYRSSPRHPGSSSGRTPRIYNGGGRALDV